MKVVFDKGNCVVVRYSVKEQQAGKKEFEALWEEDETGELYSFSDQAETRIADFDKLKEAVAFLDRLGFFFDQYKAKDYDFVHSII